MISAVIVTYNEQEVLKNCLDSIVNICDEIIVVDLGSNDQTLKIAKQYRVKIFSHRKVDYVEMVRDFAISKTRGDWILVLDPDERMTSTLWDRLADIILEDKYAAVNIPRKNIFFGRWITHTNWWPDWHIRFFKKGKVKWSERIHVYPTVEGNIFNLPPKEELAIYHYGYNTIKEFVDRQNRYSSIEAKNLYDSGKKFSWTNFFWRPVREFLIRFVRHLGFLDGFLGLSLTFLMMIYQLEVMIKLWELEQKK